MLILQGTSLKIFLTLLADRVDILAIAETKLDDSFPTNQVLTEGFQQSFGLDINQITSLPAKILSNYTLSSNFQGIPFELNEKKIAWLFLNVFINCLLILKAINIS